MSVQGKVRGFSSSEMKTLIEKYCSDCMFFLSENSDGSTGNIDPAALGVPDSRIDNLSPGTKPYEVRVCDAQYVPDGNGGCKNYRKGRLLDHIRGVGIFQIVPFEKYKFDERPIVTANKRSLT